MLLSWVYAPLALCPQHLVNSSLGSSNIFPRELLCEDKAVSLSERNGINAIRQDRQ